LIHYDSMALDPERVKKLIKPGEFVNRLSLRYLIADRAGISSNTVTDIELSEVIHCLRKDGTLVFEILPSDVFYKEIGIDPRVFEDNPEVLDGVVNRRIEALAKLGRAVGGDRRRMNKLLVS
jgi:hypothetical protein